MFSTSHTNSDRNRKNLFHEARLVYFADAGKGAGAGADKNLTSEEELKKQQKEPEKQDKGSMLAKIDNLSPSIKEQAKKAYNTGDRYEKTVLLQLTEAHSITEEMFRRIYNCLHGTEEEKLLARKKIDREIDSTSFELALTTLEGKDKILQKEIKNLLTKLDKGQISGQDFEKEIKKRKKLILSKTSALSPEITDEWLKRSTQEKIDILLKDANELLKEKVGTPEDSLKLKSAVEKLDKKDQELMDAHDSIGALAGSEEAVRKNPELKYILMNLLNNKEFMGDYALREPISINEPSAPATAIDAALEKAEKKFKIKLSPIFKTSFHAKALMIKNIRDEYAKAEKEIGSILGPVDAALFRKSYIKNRLEEAKKWLGIELKPGTQLKFMDVLVDDATGEKKYFWNTSEILRVSFEKPQEVEGTERETMIKPEDSGLVVIVTAAGTFSVANLRKWMDACRAYQNIPTLEELEKTIKLSEIGQKIEKGMELEYDRIVDLDENANFLKEIQYVKVADIKDGKIILDKPVTVLYKEEFGERPITDGKELKILEKNLTQQEFTPGEFARWFIRKSVRPKMKVENFNRSSSFYHKNSGLEGSPATVNEGSNTHMSSPPVMGNSHYYRVENVDPQTGNFIVNMNGNRQRMSPAQFLETVRKNDLISANPNEYANRAIASLDKSSPIYQEEFDAAKDDQETRLKNTLDRDVTTEKNIDPKLVQPDEGDVAILPPSSKLKQMWEDTTFLALQDIVFLVKSIYEFHIRRWERKMKGRVGKAGEHMPVIAAEMARLKESAEHEEVEKYKTGITHLGIFEIRERMYHAGSRDELKACILDLVEKGHMRWDDKKVWAVINEYTDPDKRIPIPLIDDPAAKVQRDPDTGKWRTGQDLIEGAIDAMWGEGIFGKWYNQNHGAYLSGCKAYKDKGDQLENDPKGIGGLGAEMQKLLKNFKEGKWVNPMQYEGLFEFSIEKGKLTVEEKLYYLLQGLAYNLLGMDRLGFVDGILLNHMPWLDYFTQGKREWKFGKPHRYPDGVLKYGPPFPPPEMQGPEYGYKPYSQKDLQWLAAYLDADPDSSKKDSAPGPRTKNVLWKYLLQDHDARVRIDKALQQSERLDHDDLHFIVPMAGEAAVERLCMSGGTTREHFSLPGYLNVFPGFNHRLHNIQYLEEPQQAIREITETLSTFTRYDAILDTRFKKTTGSSYVRIDRSKFDPHPVVDENSTKAHREQIQRFILDIGKAYGFDFSRLYQITGALEGNPEEQKKQDMVEGFISNFKSNLSNLVASDGGRKLLAVTRKYQFIGQGVRKYEEDFLKSQCYLPG